VVGLELLGLSKRGLQEFTNCVNQHLFTMIPYGLFSSIKSIARWTFLDKPSRKLQNKPPTFTVVPWQIQNPSEFYCSTLADTKPEWIAALSCFFAQVFIRLIDTMCGTRTSHFSLTSGLWLVDWQHSGNIPALCSDVRIFPVTEHIFIASKSRNEIAGQLSQWRAQQYLESVSWSVIMIVISSYGYCREGAE